MQPYPMPTAAYKFDLLDLTAFPFHGLLKVAEDDA